MPWNIFRTAAHPPKRVGPVLRLGLALAFLCVASAGWAQDSRNGQEPRDTGSMAYPEPVPGSGTTRPAVASPDTGSMAYPEAVPGSGTNRRAVGSPDTGSMAYPEPVPGSGTNRPASAGNTTESARSSGSR